MKYIKRLAIVLIILLPVFVLIVLITGIVPKATYKNSVKVSGTLSSVSYTDGEDIVFLLNNGKSYYINRGLRYGPSKQAVDTLVGKKIILFYVNHYSFLSTSKKCEHISFLSCNNKTIYSEIVDK